ncbi:expressed unknown protein [Seminavis robusta]|uniref:Uncharacterized protein n=1 Tax=Seminavis robusta TaxID=568900 RepID=A0A9N8ERB8_9STRA|nr:expressed unknown protein [Seminavis robusta]|eukprot:Sro1492_g277200.1 n/a (192) ;mRNA; r:8562-9137
MPSKTEVAISVGLLMAMLGLLWEFSSLRQYRQSPHNTQRSTRTDLMYSNTTAVILQTFRSELEDAKQELLEAKSRLNKQEKSMQKLSKLKEEIQNNASSKQRDLENQVAKLEQQMGKLLETNKKGMVPAQQQPQQNSEAYNHNQQQQQRQRATETEDGQQVTKKEKRPMRIGGWLIGSFASLAIRNPSAEM